MISQQIREYLETVADPTLREVLTAILMKAAVPAEPVAAPAVSVAAPAVPVAAPAEPDTAPAEPVAAPDAKPTLFSLLVKPHGKTNCATIDLIEFDRLTEKVPTLFELIPDFETLSAADIAKYNALYAEAVADGRRMLNYEDDELVDKMVKSIMTTGLSTSGELAMAAAALVDMNATRTTPVVTINLQVRCISEAFSPCLTDLYGKNTKQRTKMLTDAVVEKTTAALADRLTKKWYKCNSFGECTNYRPLGSEKMCKFIVSGRFVVKFIPRTTAEGRAEFIRLAALVVPQLAPLLTDDLAKRMLDENAVIEIGSKSCEILVKCIIGATMYDATALNADIDARGIEK